MTRVLVTGAGGFLGSHLVETLLDATDWHVVCVDSFRHNGITDRLAEVTYGYTNRITVVTHDLGAPFSTLQVNRIAPLDYIINTASLCQVDQSIEHPKPFVRNNVELMLNVLHLARSCGTLSRMIHMSTDEVYGPRQPATATDHRPSSPYAASKAMQEDLCHAYAHTYDVPITIVNSANMFGERQSRLAFIPRILDTLEHGNTLIIHTRDGVPTKRNYTYVGNVAEYIVNLLGDDLSGDDVKADRIWLPGQREENNLELAQTIAELYDAKLSYITREATEIRPGHDDYYPELGGPWKVRWSFTEGLVKTINWAKMNPEWLLT